MVGSLHAKGEKADKLTLQQTSQNVARINSYFGGTVAKVEEQYALEDTSTINGLHGTTSHKTQQSLGPLTKGLAYGKPYWA